MVEIGRFNALFERSKGGRVGNLTRLILLFASNVESKDTFVWVRRLLLFASNIGKPVQIPTLSLSLFNIPLIRYSRLDWQIRKGQEPTFKKCFWEEMFTCTIPLASDLVERRDVTQKNQLLKIFLTPESP